MDLGLKGRVAAVAASSRGLGRAVAFALAREGADVAICARGEEALLQTASELRRIGVRIHPVGLDITRPGQAAAFVDGAAASLGRLDILVTNAGGPPSGPADSFGEEGYRAAIESNLISTVAMTFAALAHMRERGWGRIVNISSLSIKQPLEGLILSSTARAGSAGFAKTLADHVAPDGITINTVCPGLALTDRVRSLAEERAERSGATVEAVLKSYESTIPMRRIGSPDEVAALVAFLASEPAGYITGTTIAVDGGMARTLI